MSIDANGSSPSPALALVDIRKRFGATQALDGVSLSIGLGEFVALLGPNGAGKSTLIKILDGVYRPDSGSVEVRAGEHGMGVVHQDLGLVPTMTVAENLALGVRRRGWINPAKTAAAAADALDKVGLSDVDPHALVESLNLGRQALVAVAKVLSRGAQIVIVDELTAGLHPNESRWLVQQLRDAAHRGVTVVMVTHKLREIVGIADRYVILIDGKVGLDGPGADVTLDEMIAVMSSGRSISDHMQAPRDTRRAEGAVCSLQAVHVGAAGPVDLELSAGEIVGLTGLVGSGLHDIAYVAAGRLRPDSGIVRLDKETRRTCVPAHRETEGMFPEETEEFNLSAGTWAKWTRHGFLDVRAMRRECGELADRLSLVPRDLDAGITSLSGGNQQKALLGRALLDPPDLLVLCEPTRGVDVATRREIYSQIRRVAESGTAILVASTDLEDLAAIAHRAAIVGADGALGPWFEAERIPELALELI